jgi:hypothetical protein
LGKNPPAARANILMSQNTTAGANLDAIKRRQALDYGIDQLRRCISAASAASHGEPNAMRAAVLQSVHQRLSSMLVELRALT